MIWKMEVAIWFVVWAILPVSPSVKALSSSSKDGANAKSTVAKTYDVFGQKARAIDIPQESFPSADQMKEMEDAMPGCQHGWFKSVYAGCQLHYRKWLPSGEPKGIVIFNHGIAAHSGRALIMDDGRKLGTSLLADALTKEGFALYAFDQLGHGYSEGIRWYVPSYKVNRDDCVSFAKLAAEEHSEGTPIFIMGESYGGCLTLHTAQYMQDNPLEKPQGFDSVMLLAPAIIGDLPPYPVYFLLRYVLAPLFPKWIPFFMPNPVSVERVWRDEQVVSIVKKRTGFKLDGGGFPFRLGTAVSLVMALADVRKEVIPRFSVPYCVIHGESDYAVPIVGTDFLVEQSKTKGADRIVHRIPEAYHDVLADPVAEKVVEYLMGWIKSRMASKEEDCI